MHQTTDSKQGVIIGYDAGYAVDNLNGTVQISGRIWNRRHQ